MPVRSFLRKLCKSALTKLEAFLESDDHRRRQRIMRNLIPVVHSELYIPSDSPSSGRSQRSSLAMSNQPMGCSPQGSVTSIASTWSADEILSEISYRTALQIQVFEEEDGIEKGKEVTGLTVLPLAECSPSGLAQAIEVDESGNRSIFQPSHVIHPALTPGRSWRQGSSQRYREDNDALLFQSPLESSFNPISVEESPSEVSTSGPGPWYPTFLSSPEKFAVNEKERDRERKKRVHRGQMFPKRPLAERPTRRTASTQPLYDGTPYSEDYPPMGIPMAEEEAASQIRENSAPGMLSQQGMVGQSAEERQTFLKRFVKKLKPRTHSRRCLRQASETIPQESKNVSKHRFPWHRGQPHDLKSSISAPYLQTPSLEGALAAPAAIPSILITQAPNPTPSSTALSGNESPNHLKALPNYLFRGADARKSVRRAEWDPLGSHPDVFAFTSSRPLWPAPFSVTLTRPDGCTELLSSEVSPVGESQYIPRTRSPPIMAGQGSPHSSATVFPFPQLLPVTRTRTRPELPLRSRPISYPFPRTFRPCPLSPEIPLPPRTPVISTSAASAASLARNATYFAQRPHQQQRGEARNSREWDSKSAEVRELRRKLGQAVGELRALEV